MIRRTTLVVGLATCATALVPGSALAVTGQADKACYSHVPTKGSEPIVVTLTGGEPGASFLVTASVPGHGWGSAGSAPGTYDAAGNGTVQITDVYPPSGTIDPVRGGKIALSVRSYASAGTFDTPLGDVLVTNLAIDVASRPSNPSSRRKVRVSGTPFAHKRLYGFVVRGKKSKHVLRRFSLGRADVCGFAATKAVVAPKGYRTGTYWLYVNAGGKLNRAHSLAYSFRIYRSYF